MATEDGSPEPEGMAASIKQLSLVGKRKIQNAAPFIPEQTIENVKEDVEWARSGLNSAER